MRVPVLEGTEGWCLNCEKWFALENGMSALPDHEGKGGEKKCPKSRYSPEDIRYVVKGAEEAQSLAEFIRDDDGKCLISALHSLTCEYGEGCNKERLMLAQALARYYL